MSPPCDCFNQQRNARQLSTVIFKLRATSEDRFSQVLLIWKVFLSTFKITRRSEHFQRSTSRIPRVELVHGNRNRLRYLAVERFIRIQRLPDFCIRIVRTFGNLEAAPRRLARRGSPGLFSNFLTARRATRRVRLRIFILVLPQFRIGLVHKVSSSCGYLIRHQVRLHVILYPAQAW